MGMVERWCGVLGRKWISCYEEDDGFPQFPFSSPIYFSRERNECARRGDCASVECRERERSNLGFLLKLMGKVVRVSEREEFMGEC